MARGARGPVTHAESRRILDEIRRKSPRTGIFEHHSSVHTSGSASSPSRRQAGSGDAFDRRPWRDTQVRIEGPVVADFHAKTATVDGVWSRGGSTNLDWRSLLPASPIPLIPCSPDRARAALVSAR